MNKKSCLIILLLSVLCIGALFIVVSSPGECTYPLRASRIYTYENMLEDLHKLETTYPDIVETSTIGRSAEGVPLHMIELGKGERKILIVGSLHAREWINTPLLMEMAKTYAGDYYGTGKIGGEPIEHILNTHTFYIVPLANPDGVKLQQFGANAFPRKKYTLLRMNNSNTNFTRWKSNIRGVDLNRNWNVQWNEPRGGPVSNSPGEAFYKGKSPESEPEVKAIADWVRANNPLMLLDFHSSGEVFFWYYYQTGSALERDRNIVRAMERYSGYRAESVNKNKGVNTSITRWAVMVRGVPGVCVENGVYTNTYQDMRNFNYIINKVRYLIPVAVINMPDYPVYVPVKSVSLNLKEKQLESGGSFTLKASIEPADASNHGVIWSSDSPRIASVDEHGNVTALEAGHTVIRAETKDGGKKASCLVEVLFIKVEDIRLLYDEITLYLKGVNSKATVMYRVKPDNATDKSVSFATENAGVINIDAGGRVTALKEGTEKVTVITTDGFYYAAGMVEVIDDGIFYGDADGNGVIEVSDAIAVLRHIAGLTVIEEELIKNADVTKSGDIVVMDAIAILRYIVGLGGSWGRFS